MATKTVPVVDVEQSLALIEKGQQLAGHFPDAEDMDRARRILTGELSPEAAEVELQESLARLSERARSRAARHG
ncbi:MAG: hypothetical protein QM630_07320 [Microbacterium sp.]